MDNIEEDHAPIDLYFSQRAADALGTLVYRTLEGVEVEVTIIGTPGEWPNTVKVGQTAGDYSGFVRSNRRRDRGILR